MRERDTVRFELAGKRRLGVVIEVQPDLVRIAYGTSQDHVGPCAVVRPDTRQGRAFLLRDDTRFYGANTCWERRAQIEPGKAPCSWELFFEIRKLVEEHDAMLEPP